MNVSGLVSSEKRNDAGRLSFEGAPLLRTKSIPGPLSKAALDAQNKIETHSRSYTSFFPMAVSEGRGSTIKDFDGNLFIDWFAGICVINLGHGNPLVINAIKSQIDRATHIMELPTEARMEFLRTLDETLPGDLRGNASVLFTISGADACEAAISLARTKTRKKTIVAFGGAYHGVHGAIVGATANYHYREYAGLSPYEIHHLPFPYKYRFPIKVPESDISKAVVDNLEYLIKDGYSGVSPVAGVIVEPVQGEGGYIVPPDDFLPMLREVTEKHAVPLIVDEVQSGVGRTGKIWATEHANITPDIVCISKSIGGGIPASMIAYRKEYDEGLPSGYHLGTYRGNPVALAAGNAILKHLQDSDLLSKVSMRGRIIMNRFKEITEDIEQVGEVRGKGFMIGIELVRDRISREPNAELAIALRKALFEKGLLMHTCGHFGNVMRFMAPLTIEDDLVDKGLEIFDSTIHGLTKNS